MCILYDSGDVQPLDVYRGNTELKIKGYYQDSTFVPIDSVVIFKRNYKYGY